MSAPVVMSRIARARMVALRVGVNVVGWFVFAAAFVGPARAAETIVCGAIFCGFVIGSTFMWHIARTDAARNDDVALYVLSLAFAAVAIGSFVGGALATWGVFVDA